jgi:hypothetical protein
MVISFKLSCPRCRNAECRRVQRRWWMRLLPLAESLVCDDCSAEILALFCRRRSAGKTECVAPPPPAPATKPEGTGSVAPAKEALPYVQMAREYLESKPRGKRGRRRNGPKTPATNAAPSSSSRSSGPASAAAPARQQPAPAATAGAPAAERTGKKDDSAKPAASAPTAKPKGATIAGPKGEQNIVAELDEMRRQLDERVKALRARAQESAEELRKLRASMKEIDADRERK